MATRLIKPSKYTEHIVYDDAGFIAFLDPFGYESFVRKDATFDDLMRHVVEQMKQKRVLMWQVESEAQWDIRISKGLTNRTGFREVTGDLRGTDNFLCLTNFGSLYDAAFDYTVTIPADDDVLVPIEPKMYRVRIVQMKDPDHVESDDDEYDENEDFEFLIEYEAVDEEGEAWTKIAWRQD